MQTPAAKTPRRSKATSAKPLKTKDRGKLQKESSVKAVRPAARKAKGDKKPSVAKKIEPAKGADRTRTGVTREKSGAKPRTLSQTPQKRTHKAEARSQPKASRTATPEPSRKAELGTRPPVGTAAIEKKPGPPAGSASTRAVASRAEGPVRAASGNSAPVRPAVPAKSSVVNRAGRSASAVNSPPSAAPASPPTVRRPAPVMTFPADDGGGLIRIMPDDAPLPKSPLSRKELTRFRKLLLERRATLSADMRQLSNEAFDRNSGVAADRSAVPLHMADVGTDNYEQEFTLGLIDNERALVREIDDALERIDDGTYGICLKTHRPIGIARLEAKPWARYCIEYARLREQGRVP